jgi:hypothetical protein
MKLFVILIMTFMICGVKNADNTIKFDDLVGKYNVNKKELVKEYPGGWNYSIRHERTLILYQDSTYDEINISFETFDIEDYFGSWNVKDGQLILNSIGELKYVDGSYKRVEQKKEKHFERVLEILSKSKLKLLEAGFLKNEVLIKQSKTKHKTN